MNTLQSFFVTFSPKPAFSLGNNGRLASTQVELNSSDRVFWGENTPQKSLWFGREELWGQLEPLLKALEDSPLTVKYARTDWKDNFNLYPRHLQKFLASMANMISVKEIDRYNESEETEILKASTGLLYEYLKFQALKQGVLTDKYLEQLVQIRENISASQEGGDFYGLFEQAAQQLNDAEQTTPFQISMGITKKQTAENLLALMGIQLSYAHQASENQFVRGREASTRRAKNRIYTELNELTSLLRWPRLVKQVLKGGVRASVEIPERLPLFHPLGSWVLERTLLGMARRSLKAQELDINDMHRYLTFKYISRNLFNVRGAKYGLGKPMSRPFETIVEAATLNHLKNPSHYFDQTWENLVTFQ